MSWHAASTKFRLFLVAFLATQTTFATADTAIGVLEHLRDNRQDSPFYHVVRVLFKKSGDEWISFKHSCDTSDCLVAITKEFPAETHWTISFEGKNLGDIVGKTPQKFKNYSSIGQQDLQSPSNIPTVGQPSSEFSGWTQDAVFRPLVVVSKPFFKDPDSWKPFHSSDQEIITKLRLDFKKRHPTCECSEFDDGEPPCKPVQYAEKQVLLSKAYQSSKKWKLMKFELKCAERFGVLDTTYAVSPDGVTAHLGNGLLFVDAGDYDNDGHSEVIFKRGGYNRDYYLIFYRDFSRKTEFSWSYH